MHTLTARGDFESTHRATYPSRCDRPHGHHFTIRATISHEQMEDGLPRGGAGIIEAVSALAKEFDHRDLTEMSSLADQTLPALAAYFFERLAGSFGSLYSVEVSDGWNSGGISRW